MTPAARRGEHFATGASGFAKLSFMPNPEKIEKKAAPPASVEKQIAGFIDKFTPEHALIIRQCRDELRRMFPTANEIIYDNYNFFVIG